MRAFHHTLAKEQVYMCMHEECFGQLGGGREGKQNTPAIIQRKISIGCACRYVYTSQSHAPLSVMGRVIFVDMDPVTVGIHINRQALLAS